MRPQPEDRTFGQRANAILDRTLTLEMVRVTEAAARAAAEHVAGGNDHKNAIDAAAVAAMRTAFNDINFSAEMLIGEGSYDAAPVLPLGTVLGTMSHFEPEFDLAIDPIDGTNSVATGRNDALSVALVGEKGKILPVPDMKMLKLVGGPKLRAADLSLNDSIEDILNNAAAALGKSVSELVVATLGEKSPKGYTRIYQQPVIKRLQQASVQLRLVHDTDIGAGIGTALPTKSGLRRREQAVDLYYGYGGAIEGVLTAAAIRCMGGIFQGRLDSSAAKSSTETRDAQTALAEADLSETTIYAADDLASGEIILALTGVTDGELVNGVHKEHGRAKTDSLVFRTSTDTVRRVESYHQPLSDAEVIPQ